MYVFKTKYIISIFSNKYEDSVKTEAGICKVSLGWVCFEILQNFEIKWARDENGQSAKTFIYAVSVSLALKC